MRLSISVARSAGLHAITTNKRQPRDFSYQQLLAEIERGQRLRALFALSRRIVASLDLSAESARYYASLVEYYTVYKLKRMDREAVQLYLLCFIHDRYRRLTDDLESIGARGLPLLGPALCRQGR